MLSCFHLHTHTHLGSSLRHSLHPHGHPRVCGLFTLILPFYFLLYLPLLFLFLGCMKSVVNLHNSCNEGVDASGDLLLSTQMEAPSSWKIVILLFLRQKDAEPKKGIRSYRAIALTSVMSKWYASCIITRTRVAQGPNGSRIARLCERFRHPRVMPRSLPHLTLTTNTNSLSPTSPILQSFSRSGGSSEIPSLTRSGR